MHKLLILMSLFLSACSSIPQNQVDERLLAWKNTSIDEIIKYWGLPTKQNKINGRYYAEWVNQQRDQGNTSVSIGTGHLSSRSSVGFGVTLFDLGGSNDVCSRSVEYNEVGLVLEINWNGNQDYCFSLTPDRNKILENNNSQ